MKKERLQADGIYLLEIKDLVSFEKPTESTTVILIHDNYTGYIEHNSNTRLTHNVGCKTEINSILTDIPEF